ncbi:hypothetical protein BGZ81_011759, partial [Podila clonocystis]
MAMQLKSDFVMVINYRKGPVGTHIPLQTQFPASVPYRLAMSRDTFSSLMTRISGLAKQFPHPVQMQCDSSLYLYVESFKKSHSDPKDHYIELTAENYQAALTQDWLRQYQQCLSKPEFSYDKTDTFIKLQLFIFLEDYTPPVMKRMKTYPQPPVQITAPQAPVPARAMAPTQPAVQAPARASVAQKATTSFNANCFPQNLERLKEQQQQRLITIQQVQQRLQLKHQPQQYIQQWEQFLEEAQLEEERQQEAKQRQEEEEQRQRQLQQNKLRKKQEQERARQKTQEAL